MGLSSPLKSGSIPIPVHNSLVGEVATTFCKNTRATFLVCFNDSKLLILNINNFGVELNQGLCC